MIKARVTAVIDTNNGKRAFAQSGALVTKENPFGEAMFYLEPPHWTHGRPPYRGQAVVFGSVERIQLPHWNRPKWRASEVSPAWAVKKFSPKRYASPSMAPHTESASVWTRLATLLGFGARPTADNSTRPA